MQVPPEFAALVERIKADTAIPTISITTEAVDSLPLAARKFFGEPYLPHGAEHPKDSDGKPLGFLAQIRFDELPTNDQFPDSGMVQFWIGTDDVMGLDFDELTENRCVVSYYPTVDQTVSETAYESPNEETGEDEYYSPYLREQTFALTFEAFSQPMSLDDYRFEPLFLAAYRQAFPNDDLPHRYALDKARSNYLFEHFYRKGHQLGGYPCFTQMDPRQEDTDLDFLLFQMDSEDEIMWGDVGVDSFFINSRRLIQADFSRVGYTWDCG